MWSSPSPVNAAEPSRCSTRHKLSSVVVALSGRATQTRGPQSTLPRALAAGSSPRGTTAIPPSRILKTRKGVADLDDDDAWVVGGVGRLERG